MTKERMTLHEFAQHTARTWHAQGKDRDLQHAFLGMGDEIGELRSNLKKQVGYGKDIDTNNVLEEAGDFAYFLVRAWVTMWDIKLLGRYKIVSLPRTYWRIKALNAISQEANKAEAMALFAGDEDTAVQHLSNALAHLESYLDTFHYSLEDAMEANVSKLQKRYPEKWTVEAATNRDREAERTAIDNHIPNVTD
jgi:NTP pyrophosphatase (non-canonical NTP hydrolase)